MYSEYKMSRKAVSVAIGEHMAHLGTAFPITITNLNKDSILADL